MLQHLHAADIIHSLFDCLTRAKNIVSFKHLELFLSWKRLMQKIRRGRPRKVALAKKGPLMGYGMPTKLPWRALNHMKQQQFQFNPSSLAIIDSSDIFPHSIRRLTAFRIFQKWLSTESHFWASNPCFVSPQYCACARFCPSIVESVTRNMCLPISTRRLHLIIFSYSVGPMTRRMHQRHVSH